MGENELRRADYFAHARDVYRMEVLGLDPEETEQPPIALQSGFDGLYWNLEMKTCGQFFSNPRNLLPVAKMRQKSTRSDFTVTR